MNHSRCGRLTDEGKFQISKMYNKNSMNSQTLSVSSNGLSPRQIGKDYSDINFIHQ